MKRKGRTGCWKIRLGKKQISAGKNKAMRDELRKKKSRKQTGK